MGPRNLRGALPQDSCKRERGIVLLEVSGSFFDPRSLVFDVHRNRSFIRRTGADASSPAVIGGSLTTAVERFGPEEEAEHKDRASKDGVEPLRPAPAVSSSKI